MKLETTIKPRRDGSLTAEIDGVRYAFAKDELGRLVADVDNEAHIAHLLNTGNVMPADDEDFAAAAVIAGPAEDDESLDDGEDEALDGLPIEENTPPSGRKPRKVK